MEKYTAIGEVQRVLTEIARGQLAAANPRSRRKRRIVSVVVLWLLLKERDVWSALGISSRASDATSRRDAYARPWAP